MSKSKEDLAKFYYLVGGVPINTKGASFLTPIFARRDSEELYLQCKESENEPRFVEITSRHGLNECLYPVSRRQRCLLRDQDGDIFGYISPSKEAYFSYANELAEYLFYTRAASDAGPSLKRLIASFIELNISQEDTEETDLNIEFFDKWIQYKDSKDLARLAIKDYDRVRQFPLPKRTSALFFITASYLTDPLASHLISNSRRPTKSLSRIISGQAVTLRAAISLIISSVKSVVSMFGVSPIVDIGVKYMISSAISNSIVPSVYYVKSDFYVEFASRRAPRSKHNRLLLHDNSPVSASSYDELLETMRLCIASEKKLSESAVHLMTRDTAVTIYRYLADMRGDFRSSFSFDDVFGTDLEKLEKHGFKLEALPADKGNIVRK